MPLRPPRVVRAEYDDTTITVYQAYEHRIADRALVAGTFVAPFKLDRMTWIKPSFRWMMYRSGWAAKEGQQRILRIRVDRRGFDWALANSSLTHYDSTVHSDPDRWQDELRIRPVRVQWDPERSVDLQPLPCRAIQVGLTGEAVRRYVADWIERIDDVTPLAHQIRSLVARRELRPATALLPTEREYPVPPETADRIGITSELILDDGADSRRPE